MQNLPLYTAQDERIGRLEAQVNRLLGDYRIGSAMQGPLPVGDSSMQFRRKEGTRYYLGGAVSAVATSVPFTVPVNELWAVPFYAASPLVVDTLGIRVSTLAAGNGRLGIYGPGADLYPGRLLLDAGTVSTSTTGYKTTTFSKRTLYRGLWWLGLVCSASPIIDQIPPDNAWDILGRASTSISPGLAWRVSFTYAELPAVYPSGGTIWYTEPQIRMRVVG